MNRIPVISVIMPCYNSESYVSLAIESILKQSFKEIEFIIINDGSEDNSFSNIKLHLSDKRIKLVDLKKNFGNYRARNIGMELAKAKYLAVMDSDDIAHEQRLQIQYSYLERNKNIGCIGSQGYLINSKNKITGKIDKPSNSRILKISLLKNNYLLHPSLFMRRHLIHKYNLFYNENLRYSGDYDFVVRASGLFKVDNIPDRLLFYRVHENQISHAKFTEQVAFADFVRLNQLKALNVRTTDIEALVYLKFMKGEPLNKIEMQCCIELLNTILEANKRSRIYIHKHLIDFFKLCINDSISRSDVAIDN